MYALFRGVGGRQDAEFRRNGARRHGMVARDHHGGDARGPGSGHGLDGFRAGWVGDADQTEQG